MSGTSSNQFDLFNGNRAQPKGTAVPVPSEAMLTTQDEERTGSLTIYTAHAEKEWRARALSRTDDSRARKLIERVPRGPFRRKLAPPPSPAQLERLARKFPNFDSATACIRDYAMLCSPATGLRLRPILLTGGPGLGKTAYARYLASLLGAPMLFVNIASCTGGFTIGGLDLRWATGSPGCVFEALVLDDPDLPANRLMLIDEIDKAPASKQYDQLGAFYSLLEPLTARRFCDEACDLPIDASAMVFIATANDVDAVPAPLLSRMDVFHIRPPCPDQMSAVVESAWDDLCRDEGWWARRFAKDLDRPVVEALSQLTSTRDIVKRLRRAAGCAARDHRSQIRIEDIAACGGASETGTRRIGFA